MKKLFSNFPAIFLSFAILAFFLPHLIKGEMPIPADAVLGLYHPWRDLGIDGFNPGKFPTKNPLITDPVLQTYPWRMLAIDSFKNGQFPLWNPYSFAGQPLLANVQSAPFAIGNVLFFAMPFNFAWTLQIIGAILASSIFMYLFLREINLSKLSSVFGALVLSFGGFYVAWQQWGTIVQTAMWLPLNLYLLEKLSKKITPLPFLFLTLSFSQALLSGHLQTALYVFLASVFYIVFKSLTGKNLKFLILSVLAVALGVIISSIGLLPALEFLNNSARSQDQSYFQGRLDWFIPPLQSIQLLIPDFFGNPTTYNYWGTWNWAEFVTYIGIIPLALVLFSLTKNKKTRNFFLLLLAFSLILALENPISKIPYIFNFPLLSTLQPSRIVFLIVFSLSVLSALGLENFLKEDKKRTLLFFAPALPILLTAVFLFVQSRGELFPKIVNLDPQFIASRNTILPLILSFAFLIVVALKMFKIPKYLIVAALFTLTIFELYRFAGKFLPFTKSSNTFVPTKITAFLGNQEKPFRIMATDRRIMHPNLSSVYKIESIDGYDPLYLKNYAQFISILQSENPKTESASFNRIITPQKFSSNLINLLNVQYILSFDDLTSANIDLVETEGETKLYKNKSALPRAFFAEEVVKVENLEKEYATLLETDIDFSKKAVSAEYSFSPKSIESKSEIVNYSGQGMLLNVQTQEKKPLIVTNVYYPGWEAYIDGKETQILRANAIFQLIEIPQGSHVVEFKFVSESFYNGLYLSAFGILSSFIITTFLWRRKLQ